MQDSKTLGQLKKQCPIIRDTGVTRCDLLGFVPVVTPCHAAITHADDLFYQAAKRGLWRRGCYDGLRKL